jgi:hypothetical protein
VARKKGRESDSVADGLRPAKENDVLELDECWTYVRKRSNKRWLWVALCRRTRQVVANAQGRPLGQDLRPALESDPGGVPARQKLQRLLEILSPSFCGRLQPPAGRKVQWRASPRREIFRATAAKAGPLRPANPSGLRIRANAPLDDEAVHGVVQRSRHLTSTRYQSGEWREGETC